MELGKYLKSVLKTGFNALGLSSGPAAETVPTKPLAATKTYPDGISLYSRNDAVFLDIRQNNKSQDGQLQKLTNFISEKLNEQGVIFGGSYLSPPYSFRSLGMNIKYTNDLPSGIPTTPEELITKITALSCDWASRTNTLFNGATVTRTDPRQQSKPAAQF